MFRVIFHIDEKAKIELGLRNITNLLIDLGEENLEVELVANSEAIVMLVKANNENAAKIADLAAKGVKFAACANSMNAFNLSKEDLLPVLLLCHRVRAS